MDDKEITIAIPNTVGELIEFLKQFPENTTLDTYKTEAYYSKSETMTSRMSYEYFENLGSMSITFD
jgi:hypothetical protein